MSERERNGSANGAGRESPLVDAAWSQFAAVAAASQAERAGPLDIPGYEVLGELHRGGQGVVYLAIQESTKRKVAIKVLRHGPFASAADLARFEREVDLLARLRHPGIVAVHDRGVIAAGGAGSPYLVMDYVAGRPLDAYIADAALSVPERLELFRKFCEAVHAAHLVGIIHRDLKPANIRVDDAGEPHVLDFGLAKLADGSGDQSPGADLTETGQFIGSLPWTSPEQAEGRHDVTDVRTDVYALGVLLYFMLTGRLPYPGSQSPRELAAHIVGSAPIRPGSVQRGIGADVETIVLKCLAKEPERRYQSAGELARDVANAIAGLPIDARRDSAAYVLRKMVRRHWVSAAVAAAFVALLAGTAAATTVLYRRASHAQKVAQDRLELAEREASKAEKVGEILRELLTSMSPWEWAGANNARVLEALLDRASADTEGSLADEPEVRAALDDVLGRGYYALNNYARAEEHLTRCLELRRAGLGEGHPAVAAAESQVAALRYSQGRFEEAMTMAQHALESLLNTRGERHPDTAATMTLLSQLRAELGDFEGAIALCRRAEAAITALHGPSHRMLVGVYRALGPQLRVVGRLDESEQTLQAAMRIAQDTLPADHPSIAGVHSDLGALYTLMREHDRAERHLRESLRIRRAIYDAAHEETAITLTNLSALLAQRGSHADAEAAAREAIDMYRSIGADDQGHMAQTLGNLAAALKGQDRLDEAAAAYEEALSILVRMGSEQAAATIMGNIAQLRKAAGDLEGAEAKEREALALRRRLLGDEHLEVAYSLSNLGHTLLLRKDYAGAEPPLRRAIQIYSATLGEQHVLVGGTKGLLGRCLLALHTGGAEAAAVFEEAIPIIAAAVPPHHPRLIQDRRDLAEALIREQRYEQAESVLRVCEEALAAASTTPDLTELAQSYIRLYDAWDKPEESARWRPLAATPPE